MPIICRPVSPCNRTVFTLVVKSTSPLDSLVHLLLTVFQASAEVSSFNVINSSWDVIPNKFHSLNVTAINIQSHECNTYTYKKST